MIWVGALFLSLCSLLAECYIAHREKSVHRELENDMLGEKLGLFRAIFYLSMGSLLLAFLVSFSHRSAPTPKQGVAFIVDTASFGQKTPLSAAKGCIQDALGGLGGIPCSLYEINGSTMQKVVPRTIDRIFYNLLLDSLEESYAPAEQPTLYALQEEMRKTSTMIVPWMVVVTARELYPNKLNPDSSACLGIEGGGQLDGISCLNIRGANTTITSWMQGIAQQQLSIAALAEMVSEYLIRAETPPDVDEVDIWVLVVTTGLALVSYIFWRKAIVPIGMGLLFMGVLSAYSPEEMNWAFRNAQTLAESGSLQASQEEIENLLSTVTNKVARKRLLFDRALLAYEAGEDEEAYVWLSMESSTVVDKVFEERSSLLKGYLYLRLIEQTNPREKQLWKTRLQEWLTGRPSLPAEMYDALELAISSPNLHPDEIVETARTLFWLEQQSRCAAGLTWPCSVAMDLGNKTRSIVAKRLQAFSSQYAGAFMQDLQGVCGEDTLIRLRLWYEIALLPSPENVVTTLLEEAVDSSQDSLCFPARSNICSSTLSFIEKRLDQLEGLPQRMRGLLQTILEGKRAVKDPSMWYARSVLWSSLQHWDMKAVQPIAEMLCRQVGAPLSKECKKTLAFLTDSVCSLPGTPPDVDPLSALCDTMLTKWYDEDPSAALKEVIAQLVQRWPDWEARYIRFMSGVMQRAKRSDSSIAAAVAHGVGTNVGAYDLVLIGRLWQVAVTKMTNQMEVVQNLNHLILGFQEMKDMLRSADEKTLRSLCLLIAVYPQIAEALAAVSFFQDDAQRLRYEDALDDWGRACQDIRSRIETPSTFRIPRVELALDQAIGALRNMRDLLEPSTPSSPSSGGMSIGSASSLKGAKIRPEDAVRLFQEMDRSDRKLFEG